MSGVRPVPSVECIDAYLAGWGDHGSPPKTTRTLRARGIRSVPHYRRGQLRLPIREQLTWADAIDLAATIGRLDGIRAVSRSANHLARMLGLSDSDPAFWPDQHNAMIGAYAGAYQAAVTDGRYREQVADRFVSAVSAVVTVGIRPDELR